MDYKKLTKEIKTEIKKTLKKSRYEHSIRVAKMCKKICKRFNLDEEIGYFLGVAHDMCKYYSKEELTSIVQNHGIEIIQIEKERPALLHGPVAAILLKEKYGVEDDFVLEAIYNHTSGKVGMCDYSKALFIADKIEVGRPQSTKRYRKSLFKLSLDKMTYAVVKENYDFLTNKGWEIYPQTLAILQDLEKRVGEK